MKRIEAIVRPAKANDVYEALERVGHPGLMISEIEGHGVEKGVEHQVRGKIYKVSLVTKTRIESICPRRGNREDRRRNSRGGLHRPYR